MRQHYLLLFSATTLAVTNAKRHTGIPTIPPSNPPSFDDKCPKEEMTKCEEDSCGIRYNKPDYYSEDFDPIFCKNCDYDYTPTCPDHPLVFRTSSVVSSGKFSLENAIGLTTASKADAVHVEQTSRRLIDGDTFKLVGQKRSVGVGICCEGCYLNSRIKDDFRKCVTFYGNETTIRGTDEDGEPYEDQMARQPSKSQGFTYDEGDNCVSHIGDWSDTCIKLPDYFAEKKLRAIGFVWDSNVAQIKHECNAKPTAHPTKKPIAHPTKKPNAHPTEHPTKKPIAHPTKKPIAHPTKKPNAHPTEHPTKKPIAHPTKKPTTIAHPTKKPTTQLIPQMTKDPSS